MSDPLLDDFQRFSERILIGIEQNERPARKYKTTLGLINQIFKTTHEMVEEIVERVERAATLGEAEAALKDLNHEPLTEAFRLEGLCDAFEALGIALENLNNAAAASGALHPLDVAPSAELAQRLMNREAEVSDIYLSSIQTLADLVQGSTSDLAEIRGRAREARATLTRQMVDFDSKARQLLRTS
jgi:hypothetical protein